jgi:hypothetical protein
MNHEIPKRMQHLPLTAAGHPIPFFVAYVNGKPDFRVMDADAFETSMNRRACWLCGRRITGVTAAFVIGPMCAVNRISAEPPSHVDCALYAARACPFLSNPEKVRRDSHMPENVGTAAGIGISRNPGVALVWVTRHFAVVEDGNGYLFQIGEPTRTFWLARGRDATREEVMASIDSGLPILQEMARDEGPDAEADLERKRVAAMVLLPA